MAVGSDLSLLWVNFDRCEVLPDTTGSPQPAESLRAFLPFGRLPSNTGVRNPHTVLYRRVKSSGSVGKQGV